MSPAAPHTTVADAVGRILVVLGTRHAFGVVGSGNLVVTNALIRSCVRFHPARREDGAICMADGYARVTDEVGICSVHQGPGLTNAITGLAEAVKSRTPMLVPASSAVRAALRLPHRPVRAGDVGGGDRALVVSPLRLQGGTGSPSRVYAFVPRAPLAR
ncbi:MAG: thiamine pyrophosphate-binding protein [Solirubrobacteraceae bacterium]